VSDRLPRSPWERLAPHWLLIVVLALVAAFVLWLASYGIAQ